MDWQTALLKLSFGSGKRASFYEDMHAFLRDGIPAYGVLSKMEEIARNRMFGRDTAKIYRSMMAVLKTGAAGKSFSTALARWVPPQEAAMLSGAENAGGQVLIETLAKMGALLRRQVKARLQLMKSVGIAAVFAVALVVLAYYIISMLVPPLQQFASPKLSANAQFAMAYFAFGEWVIHNGIYILVAILILAGITAWALPNWTGRGRLFFDKWIPPFTLYRRAAATYFLSNTDALTQAGVPMKEILTDMRRLGSKYQRHYAALMLRVLETGRSTADVVALGPMPRDTSDRLRVYALMPNFNDAMKSLAESNFARYETSIVAFGATIQLLMAILLSIFAGATVWAIFNFSMALKTLMGP